MRPQTKNKEATYEFPEVCERLPHAPLANHLPHGDDPGHEDRHQEHQENLFPAQDRASQGDLGSLPAPHCRIKSEPDEEAGNRQPVRYPARTPIEPPGRNRQNHCEDPEHVMHTPCIRARYSGADGGDQSFAPPASEFVYSDAVDVVYVVERLKAALVQAATIAAAREFIHAIASEATSTVSNPYSVKSWPDYSRQHFPPTPLSLLPAPTQEPTRWWPEPRSLRGTAQVGSGVVVGRGDRRREPLHGRSRS